MPKMVNPCFLPLLADRSRFLVLKGGAGSGKSVFAQQKIVFRCVAESDHNILVLRKVKNTIKNSCFKGIRETIRTMGLENVVEKVNETDFTITFKPTVDGTRGSQIIFAGLDDPEKLKSIVDATSIWIEEASELELQDFLQTNLRLRGMHLLNYKQIILSFNPISEGHWLKDYFFDNPNEKIKDHIRLSETTYLDNQFLDPEYTAQLESMKDIDPIYYQIYALGLWGSFEGKYFTTFDKSKHVVEPFEIPESWTRFRAFDWGSSRPYCCLWGAIDYDGRLYIYRELYGWGGKPDVGTGEIASAVAKKIRDLEKREKLNHGVADPSIWTPTGTDSPSIQGEFANNEVYWIKAKNDRLNGWEQIKNRLAGEDPHLKIFSNCTHLVRTIGTQKHDANRPEDLDTKGEDHAVDALRYLCMSRPYSPRRAEEQAQRDPYKPKKKIMKSKTSAWAV